MRRAIAFTIVELLIVIAIIAVLMSILVPALAVAKEQATGAICLGNQRGLIQAWVLYASDNRGYIVGGDTYGYHFVSEAEDGTNHTDWVDMPQDAAGAVTATSPAKLVPQDEQRGISKGALFKYVGSNVKVFHCPGDRRFTNSTPQETGWRSYSIPNHLNGHPNWIAVRNNGASVGPKIYAVKKIDNIPYASDKYALVEEADMQAGCNGRSWALDPFGQVPLANGWFDPVAIWHNKKSTLSFADGHAAMYNWQCPRTIEWFTQKNAAKKFVCPDHGGQCPDLLYMQRHYAYIER